MNFAAMLSGKNLKRKPVRTAAMILLTALLALSVFGGSVVILSLRRGLKSYGQRLGADIVAVPDEARTKKECETILLQGIPGTFYMDEKYYEKIKTIEGVEKVAPEFFLASASAGCCSVAVQIIGFEPELDFTVQPWIEENFQGTIQDGEIIIGNQLVASVGDTLQFYGVPCRVAAKLEKTGTGLDTAVYTNMNTIRMMLKSAKELGFHTFDKMNPDKAVSAAMIKVKEGYDIDKVCGNINVKVRHIEASRSANMISSIAGGLQSFAGLVGILTAVIWVLSIVILVIAFSMIAHERVKEFAILRVMGASQKQVAGLLLTEAGMISLIGALTGLCAGAMIVFPFSEAIRKTLDLPYLVPGAGTIAAIAAGTVFLSVLTGALTSAVSAWRMSRVDAGLVLREGA